MKPDLPPVSPIAFHPMNIEMPLESRLKLPDGRMVGIACPDQSELHVYCQNRYGAGWEDIKLGCLKDLAFRLAVISARIPALEALLKQGQPPETLLTAYDDIWEQLEQLYGDGSLRALLQLSRLSMIVGEKFPPLATAGKGIQCAEMAAELGNVAAYCFLGDFYLSEGRTHEAAAAYQQGAQKGCSACEYQLAQFAERGVGGISKSDSAAFDLYADAIDGNYPPAWVAIARLWLRNPRDLPRPEHVDEMLKECAEMRCDGAAVVLAEVTLRNNQSSYAKQMVMTLYRCAAAEGDIEAQLKLASLLADEGATEMGIEPDTDEASSWYLQACASDVASPSQLAQAHLEVGHLLMNGGKYDQAAQHFSLASDTYHEAAELQSVCEEQAEKHWRWRQHHALKDSR